jgi:ankyrin repeat protein
VAPGESDLKRIVRQNDLDELKKLLSSGYDTETTDEYNRTLIENAAIHNRPDIIQILFDQGAQLRNALALARQNYRFFAEHKTSVDLLEKLEKLRREENS